MLAINELAYIIKVTWLQCHHHYTSDSSFSLYFKRKECDYEHNEAVKAIGE